MRLFASDESWSLSTRISLFLFLSNPSLVRSHQKHSLFFVSETLFLCVKHIVLCTKHHSLPLSHLSRLKFPLFPFLSSGTTAYKRAQTTQTHPLGAKKIHTSISTTMGCTSSRYTSPENTPHPPSHSNGLHAFRKIPPPPHIARDLNAKQSNPPGESHFLPRPKDSARDRTAEQNCQQKRAELPRLWDSYTRPNPRFKEFQDECYEPYRPGVIRGEIQEGFANHGRVSVPLLKKAPTTREQARQWQAKKNEVVHELDIVV